MNNRNLPVPRTSTVAWMKTKGAPARATIVGISRSGIYLRFDVDAYHDANSALRELYLQAFWEALDHLEPTPPRR